MNLYVEDVIAVMDKLYKSAGKDGNKTGTWAVGSVAPELGDRFSDVMVLSSLPCSGKFKQ